MNNDKVTAEKIIKREHELLGESGKPSKKEQKIHKILKKEFNGKQNKRNGSFMDYDFTSGFNKIMRGDK